MLRKLLIITCLLATVVCAYAKKKKKGPQQQNVPTLVDPTKDPRNIGSAMPPIRLVTPDGKVITDADLKNDANLLVMMFNPLCEHCREATMLIEKNIFLFKKTKIVLMASDNMQPHLSFFENTTKVSEYPSMMVGLDSAGFINKCFAYQSLPQLNFYDKDRKLIRFFTGDIALDSIKRYVQ